MRAHKYQCIKDFPIFCPIDWYIGLLPFNDQAKIPESRIYLTPNNNTIKEIMRIKSFKESNFKTPCPFEVSLIPRKRIRIHDTARAYLVLSDIV